LVDDWGDRIVDVLENPQELLGLDTGLKDMNRLLGGLEPKILIVIAGRPSMGKTALSLTLAMNVARKGHKVGFASLEMSERHLVERMVASMAGVSSEGMRRGGLTQKEKDRVYDALGEVRMLPIFFDCQPGVTSAELAVRARKLAATQKVELMFVDYLGLLQDRGEDEVKRLGKITTMLRAMAKGLDISVVALHQLNRQVEKRTIKIPMLSDLRGSGRVEEDSDIVLFVHRDHYYEEEQMYKSESGPATIIVAKNRQGRTGKFKLWFDSSGPSFRDYERRI